MKTTKTATLLLGPVAALMLAMCVFSAAAQSIDDAVSAYKRGDYSTALRGFRLHAQRGLDAAQYILGIMYAEGRGVRRDDAESARWFRRAAGQDHAPAQYNLGVLYATGRGVGRNDAEAARWYRRAAEQGHARAQYNLGVRYLTGSGVRKDDTEAARWLHRAAEQDHAPAQHDLGVLYATGRGVGRNDAEAARWYRRAAEQGDADAQNNLAAMYATGKGVGLDETEAARWYRRAAEQGLALAQLNLGSRYEHGIGIGRDLVQAHKWYSLAAYGLPASAREQRRHALRGRDRVASRLSAAGLAMARGLASEWQPGRSVARQPPEEETRPAPAVPAPRQPASDPDGSSYQIARLQRDLRRLGYDAGRIDGGLGEKTRAAIRQFQADAGLPVTGNLSERLEIAILSAVGAARKAPSAGRESRRRSLERKSTGTGFRVSALGHILTNAHVVRGCAEIRIPSGGTVRVAAREDPSDLALLRAPPRASDAAATFRQGRGIRPGAGVVVVGYPLRGLVASGANVSVGAVSALAGPGDDRRLIQITAPIQPGNSGGPVLDTAGNVVGVVVAKLDAFRIAQSTGDIPQNVNFAISAGAARAFLDDQGVPYETAPSDKAAGTVEVAAAARRFTVLVECWK